MTIHCFLLVLVCCFEAGKAKRETTQDSCRLFLKTLQNNLCAGKQLTENRFTCLHCPHEGMHCFPFPPPQEDPKWINVLPEALTRLVTNITSKQLHQFVSRGQVSDGRFSMGSILNVLADFEIILKHVTTSWAILKLTPRMQQSEPMEPIPLQFRVVYIHFELQS